MGLLLGCILLAVRSGSATIRPSRVSRSWGESEGAALQYNHSRSASRPLWRNVSVMLTKWFRFALGLHKRNNQCIDKEINAPCTHLLAPPTSVSLCPPSAPGAPALEVLPGTGCPINLFAGLVRDCATSQPVCCWSGAGVCGCSELSWTQPAELQWSCSLVLHPSRSGGFLEQQWCHGYLCTCWVSENTVPPLHAPQY